MIARCIPLISVLITVVFAVDFYITNPYSITKWKAGDSAKITWDILQGGPLVDSIDVDIMDGDDNNAHVLYSVAKQLPASATSVDWQIPQSFSQTNTVFVRLLGRKEGDVPAVYRYSHRFAVNNNASPAQEKKANEPSSKGPIIKAQATSSAGSESTTTTTEGFGDLSSTATLVSTSITGRPSVNGSQGKNISGSFAIVASSLLFLGLFCIY